MVFPALDARGVLLPADHLHPPTLPRLSRDQAVSELPAENDLLLSLRHMIQVRVINKIVPVSHERGTSPANPAGATTTMEVIQEHQLIPPGQVPLRPPSKDTRLQAHSIYCPATCTRSSSSATSLQSHKYTQFKHSNVVFSVIGNQF